MRFYRIENTLLFYCPGCNELHPFDITRWKWNGDLDKATFTPSLLVTLDNNKVCHSFVKEGRIEFLSDCWHDKKNMTVDIPIWEERYF